MAAPSHPPTPLPPLGGEFPQTRWSLIMEARSENPEALASLCQQYWKPLFVYAHRKGASVEDAEDLTQGFFAHLLSKDFFQQAEPDRGKLRSLLLHSFQNFIINVWKKNNAVKRGGRVEMIVIDEATKEWVEAGLGSEASPELEYERSWARELLTQAQVKLRAAYKEVGKLREFEAFADQLEYGKSARSYREISEDLGVAESSARFISFKLRERYRKLLEKAVAETVATKSEAAEELQYLLSVFQSR